MKVKEELHRQRSMDARQSRELQAKRRADLEVAEQKKRERKLKTAAGVKSWKKEAAMKKQQAEAEYQSRIKRGYIDRM